MKIDDKLNLVVPVRFDGEDVEIYAYHSPISKEVFEANYKALSSVTAELGSKGTMYQLSSGPRIASLVFMDEVRKNALESGNIDDEGNPIETKGNAFLQEIKRLTTLLVPTDNGWDMMPVDAAISKKIIDDEEWEEAESNLVFFTAHYWMAKKSNRASMASATASVLTGFTESLPVSELAKSLQKSTTVETLEKREESSVPR